MRRTFTAEEKGLFTDTIETATDFLESFGGSGSKKVIIDNSTDEEETAEGAGSLLFAPITKTKELTATAMPEKLEPSWAKFRKEPALAINAISPEAIQRLKGMTMKEVLAARNLANGGKK